MLSDIRYALRALRQSPGFMSAAVAALALGIGANTAMFSVVYAVLLKPLPYRQPDRLIWVTMNNKRFQAEIVTGPDFLDWRAMNRSFDPLAATFAADRTVTGVAEPFDVRAAGFSEPLGRILGVQPALGRDFLAEELQANASSRPVIISDRFFRRFFHGGRAALGAHLNLTDESFTVIGVMPPDFRLALPSPFGAQTEADAIIPMRVDPQTQRRDGRGLVIVQVIGRLRPGVTVAAARAEMEALDARLPKSPFIRRSDQELVVQPLRDRLLGNTGRSLIILLGAVAFVLLIACANVANLLLVRGAGRLRESAVRLALGASRARLMRQALAESVLLAMAGGAAGLLVAAGCLRLVVNWNVVVVPRLKDAALEPAVLLFAFAVSALTGIAFGMVPAFAATRTNVNWALKAGSSQTGRRRTGGVLVAAEVALSLVLLTGAGLMMKSLWVMHAATSTAAPQRVLTATLQISTPPSDRARFTSFVPDFASRVATLPGVRAAGAGGGYGSMLVNLEGATGESIRSDFFRVTPGFFTASGMRLMQGRLFTEGDGPDAPPVILINEALARRFTPGYPRQSPVGLRVPMIRPNSQTNEKVATTIVGVLADFRRSKLDAPVEPQLYQPAAQATLPNQGLELMVRAISEPSALTGAIRTIGREGGIALLKPETLAERLDNSIAPRRFEMTLLMVFASLALLLALVGIYGVVAYTVKQRTREIGVRVALGAQRGDVVRMVLAGGLKLVSIGVAVGTVAALGLTRLMESFLYGVRPTDAATFAAAAIVLVTVAALAAWIPARAAAGVDPLVALRYE